MQCHFTDVAGISGTAMDGRVEASPITAVRELIEENGHDRRTRCHGRSATTADPAGHDPARNVENERMGVPRR
jgi:hypothetical protein